MEDNDKDDDNNDKGISALGLDRDQGFSRGPPSRTPDLNDDGDDNDDDDDINEDNKEEGMRTTMKNYFFQNYQVSYLFGTTSST